MKNKYSIGEVAKMLNTTTSTLRYYDQEHLIPNLKKNPAGIREFSDENLSTLRIINCLKSAGMCIHDIKIFIEWCEIGDETLKQRLKMFENLRSSMQEEMEKMQKTMDTINFKCDYYKKAVEKQKNHIN
jgi:DNA-binding transcriptional MerR regulator